MFKPKVKIVDRDERQRRLEVIAKLSRGAYAMVGVQDASRTYPGTSTTLGQVAADMEFGTEHVPARSFLRTPIDNMEDAVGRKRARVLMQIVNEQISIADALAALGFFVSNNIKNTIYRGIDPPLAFETRRQKRTVRANKDVSPTPDTPLMDTGLLVSAVGYEVVLGDGGGA